MNGPPLRLAPFALLLVSTRSSLGGEPLPPPAPASSAQAGRAEREGPPLPLPPNYPFPDEYEIPREKELGTTAGQWRIRALFGGAYGGSMKPNVSPALAMNVVTEWMLTSMIGLRWTGAATIPLGDAPQVFAGRLGPSLHLLPYRRVDVGAFFDGGLATLDLFRANRTLLPVLGAGGTLDISLTGTLAMHVEASLQGGIADIPSAPVFLMGTATFGGGVMF